MAFRPHPDFCEYEIHTKNVDTPIPLHQRDQGYHWDDDSAENFKTFLSNQSEKLEKINFSIKLNSDANELVKEIKNSILEASNKCNLKKKTKNKKVRLKPWFDKECVDIKRKVRELGKKLRCDKGDENLRYELFEMKKRLKKSVRSKKRQHKKNILNEMEQCTDKNQKKYWKLLQKFEQKETNTTQYISPKNLVDHYRSLLNSKRPLNIPPDSTKKGSLTTP